MRWTDAKLASLKPTLGRRDQRISIEPSLYLRVRQGTGETTKRWEFRAKVNYRTRWLSLGVYPGVTLAQARLKAHALRSRADTARDAENEHPVIEARVEQKRTLAEPTVREVGEEWLELADIRAKTKALHQSNLAKDVYPFIGDIRIRHLAGEHVRQCIDAVVKRNARGQAAQIYKTCRTLINFALRNRGYIEHDPMINVRNPRPYNPRKVVARAADDREIVELFHALEHSQISQAIRLAIEFQLLTGARPTEARLATWKEIDLERALWRLSPARVKTGKRFEIHLSEQAQDVLGRAQAIDSPKGYVFPGESGGPLSELAVIRALARLSPRLAEKKIDPLRPHDLRRTFRTMLARIGVAPHIAERCINHADSNPLDSVYNAHSYRPEMIKAWDLAGSHISATRTGQAQVVAIGVRKAVKAD